MRLVLSTAPLEIRVDHARLKVYDKLRLKAIQMKAKAEGMTVEKFCRTLSRETREFYLQKLFPTKFGPVKAYRNESGAWRVDDFERGCQPYTLKTVLEANLYVHTRAYLMGLILSALRRRDKKRDPGTIILRDDDRVAIVRRGRLKLHSQEDWLETLERKKGKRTSG